MNRALLDQTFPPGAAVKNQGVVVFDSPDRKQPTPISSPSATREIASQLALHADYVRMMNRDMFLSKNINPAVRVDMSGSGPLARVDAFGILGESYVQQVWLIENTGWSDYDALNLALESATRTTGRRACRTRCRSRAARRKTRRTGIVLVPDRSNIDLWTGPSSVDCRHILSIGARGEIPKTHGANLSTTLAI